ncbi:extracellular solute-binding protein [Planctomonas sp. JC2975]|uniref:extracellular solute-binding protein n=1 Tax=Planctomonas sp. JC2975 TaxID=2729626 RepID=UPI001473032A|nr:extracellular solute-binding protein [Planctomonas sp. JC2975]NNC12383.1 extracellular solute-binding protein [Planctomonas sp. JC2975]
MTLKVTRREALGMGLASIAVGLLAGCSTTATNATPIVTGKVTGMMKTYAAGKQFKATKPLDVTMLFQDNPAYPYKSSWEIFKQIKHLTNVTLDPTVVPFANFTDKRSVLINSGKAPDIIAKTYPGQEAPFVGGGAILPVSDYVKYMPNFTKKVQDWNLDADLSTIKQSDGKYYVLPGLHQTLSPDYTLQFRDDELDKLGLKKPTTWSEVKSVLQELKKAHPDVYPYSDRWGGASAMNFAAATYGTMAGYDAVTSSNWGLNNGLIFDWNKGTYSYTPIDDNYKALVAYFAGLVKAGLMDPETFTQTDDHATAKFTTGQSYMITTNAQYVQLDRTAMDKNLGAGKYQISKAPIPGGPKGKMLAGSRLENGIMISSAAAKREDFEAFLQFVDWQWYSDAAQVMVKWGIKNETYTYKDGKYAPAEGWKLAAYGFGDPSAPKDIRIDDGFSGGNFMYGGTTAIVQSTMPAEELAWQKTLAEYKIAKPSPAVPYTTVEAQQAALKQTAIIDSTNTWTLNFMLGKKSLTSDWNDYVNELKGKGLQSYIDGANKAYHDANTKKKSTKD